jgi:hypothetical protein
VHVPVQQALAILGQDSAVQAAGMQGNTAVQWLLCVVEAHAVSSSAS